MERSKLQRTKNRLVYETLRLCDSIGSRIPLSTGRFLGRAIGRLAYRILPAERRRAHGSLSVAFPAMSAGERDALIARMFLHLGQSLFEIAWLRNLDRETLAQTTHFEGVEHLEAAVARGRGVVLFTGHCGNWEWLAAAIGLSGFDMGVVARSLFDQRINEYIVTSRMRHGIKSIGRGTSSSARELLQTLRRGAILGVLIDQNIAAEYAMVPFFGQDAATPVGPARMAIRAGASAIAAFIERRDGVQYVRFEPSVETTRSDDPVALTALMTSAIEAQIRRVPEQWVWMHRRWAPPRTTSRGDQITIVS